MDEYRMIEGKDFSAFIIGFFSFLKFVFYYITKAVSTYFSTVLLIVVLIASLGAFAWSRSKKTYEAEMVCTFKELNKKVYGELVHKLNILAEQQSYSSLAATLAIPLADAQQIVNIEGRNMAGSLLYEDITQDKSPIYIQVKAANREAFPVVQDALAHYLNTASIKMNNQVAADSLDIIKRKQYLTTNITIADSVINAIYSQLTTEGNTDTSINAPKFASLLAYKTEMESDLVMQERKAKELKKQVEILHGFIVPDKPMSDRAKILRLTIIAAIITSVSAAIVRKVIDDGKNIESV